MRISERVSWPVTWPPARGKTKSFLTALRHSDFTPLDVILSAGAVGSSGTPTAPPVGTYDGSLPEDPRAEIPLERLVAEAADGALRDVVLTQEGATVDGLPDLDLLRAEMADARGPRDGDPRAADAPWELTVTSDGESVTLYGPWATFAWLGHLAGWPCPPVPAS